MSLRRKRTFSGLLLSLSLLDCSKPVNSLDLLQIEFALLCFFDLLLSLALSLECVSLFNEELFMLVPIKF
jgi:hypothetical protein